MGEAKSTTETESWFLERAFCGVDHHYVTRISDGEHTVEGRGSTSEEAEAVASQKWEKYSDD